MRTYRKQFAVFLLSIFFVSTLLLAPAQAAVLDDVRSIIEAAYVDPLDETVLQAESIEELLKKLNDPHSVYFTAEQYRIFLDSLGDSTFSGLGVQLESVPEGVLVIKVVPGSSAEEVNIKTGDIIISVDGQSLNGMTVEEAVPIIRGPENSKIDLTIKRGGNKIPLSVLRKFVVVPSVRAELLTQNIGYINIDSFGLEAPGQFSRAVADMRSQGADSFIIDLRNNTGGYLSSALNIAGYFIGDYPALKTEVRNHKIQVYHTIDHADIIYEPTIFLVNEYSASASEILAAIVQDYNKALLIGNTTYGKGTMQTLFRLPSGEGYLKLTTARYFSPKGRSIDAKGITPDLIIKKYDPLISAQLLLGDAADSPQIILRIGSLDYRVNPSIANTPAYWSCYEEIIAQLPDYTLYRLSDQADWQVAGSQQLDARWPFYYPSYTELSHLEKVPEDKQFSVTFPQPIDTKSINKMTVELIESDTGQRISLAFLYLGSKQVILTPKAKLEAGKTYWLVVRTGNASNITTITVGPTQDAIIVAGMEGVGKT